jgi:hypothetical protein
MVRDDLDSELRGFVARKGKKRVNPECEMRTIVARKGYRLYGGCNRREL